MRPAIATILLAISVISASFAAEPKGTPITVESYYKLNWGSYREWIRLYEKNEAPVIAELERQGLIIAHTAEQPLTHMAGGPRWDFRVRVTYRDADIAVSTGGEFDKAWDEAVKKLFPQATEREAEERRRSAIVEEHWDIVVIPHSP